MILKSLSHAPCNIEIGETYRRSKTGAGEERAYILSIAPDRMGIPHVCFDLTAIRGTGKSFTERRTLGMEAFRAQFCEKVQN